MTRSLSAPSFLRRGLVAIGAALALAPAAFAQAPHRRVPEHSASTALKAPIAWSPHPAPRAPSKE